MHRAAPHLLTILAAAASLACGGAEPFHGVWDHKEDGVERAAIGFGDMTVEMARRDAEGVLQSHWRGIHDVASAGADFEGTIVWERFFELETGEWVEWDFVNDHQVRLEVAGDSLRLFIRPPSTDWDEVDYSPLTRRT